MIHNNKINSKNLFQFNINFLNILNIAQITFKLLFAISYNIFMIVFCCLLDFFFFLEKVIKKGFLIYGFI